jgi:formamidopyrimidine-DNA glycosylase
MILRSLLWMMFFQSSLMSCGHGYGSHAAAYAWKQGKSPTSMKRRLYGRSRLWMMPEGPEVRSLVDGLSDHFFPSPSPSASTSTSSPVTAPHPSAKHPWQLTEIEFISGRYKANPPEKMTELRDRLPAKLLSIDSKGKFIYFRFDGFSLWSTLGLMGHWAVLPGNYQASSDRHLRWLWRLRNQQNTAAATLLYSDQIGYGTMRISTSADELDDKLQDIGPCWLTNPISADDFIALAQKPSTSKRQVALFLMDQKKTAGIGNYILSEVLYMSRIHPWALCCDLQTEHLLALHQAINRVMQASYRSQSSRFAQARRQQLAESAFKFLVYMREVCSQGYPVRKEIGPHKRGIHWVPELQVHGQPKLSSYDQRHYEEN